jgi:hypothetical protein
MCDYSLQNVKSRAAKVGDKLVTRNFGTGTRGFAAADDLTTAVCLLPGTELAFEQDIAVMTTGVLFDGTKLTGCRTAIFRQIDKDTPHRHHDTVEFPNGERKLLTYLCEGQRATVLQLPAQPTTAVEVEEQRRAAYTG